MQGEQRLGGRGVGAMQQQVRPTPRGGGAQTLAMLGEPFEIGLAPLLGARRPQALGPAGLEEFDVARERKRLLDRIGDGEHMAADPLGENPRKRPFVASIGDRKSPISTRRVRGATATAGGSGPAGAVSACASTSANRSIIPRAAIGRVRPTRPTRSPPRTARSASASAITTARSSFVLWASVEPNRIEGERSIQIHSVCAASHSRSRT